MYACAHIIVGGVVQGVGFRYFTQKEALALGLFGYVKNLYNGDVEIEIEGPRQLIEEFIHAMDLGSRFSQVQTVHVNWKKYDKNYNKFAITG
jgi:acylphosphatase